MPLATRDRALQAELRADGSLHAALWPPDASACRGHYAVSPSLHVSESMQPAAKSQTQDCLLEMPGQSCPSPRGIALCWLSCALTAPCTPRCGLRMPVHAMGTMQYAIPICT